MPPILQAHLMEMNYSFTTSPVQVPTLTTAAVTGVTLTTAVSGGKYYG